jgi:hypothetical protein
MHARIVYWGEKFLVCLASISWLDRELGKAFFTKTRKEKIEEVNDGCKKTMARWNNSTHIFVIMIHLLLFLNFSQLRRFLSTKTKLSPVGYKRDSTSCLWYVVSTNLFSEKIANSPHNIFCDHWQGDQIGRMVAFGLLFTLGSVFKLQK